MFPWSSEFVWDAGHVVFFGALYAILATIAASLTAALWRTRRARDGRAAAVAWHGAFAELPPRTRACRHQLTGEAPGRVCANGFDCRSCVDHPRLEALRRPSVPPPDGCTAFQLPLDRLYHRGHTWVRAESGGCVTVGLDDLARRVVGRLERVELPAPGTRLEVNGPAARLVTRGSEVRVLSPVDGTVVEASGEGAGFVLRVDPGAALDRRHLLAGPEVQAWALRELERLERALGPRRLGVALADGGELVPDLGAVLARDSHDALLGDVLLEP